MTLSVREHPAATNSDTRAPLDLSHLAAELTEAAYPVALRHGAGQWLELELDLWRTLQATVEKWQARARPPH